MENPSLPTNWLAALSNANHVRKQKIGQNSLTSFRFLPPASDFRLCRGLFRGTFWVHFKVNYVRAVAVSPSGGR